MGSTRRCIAGTAVITTIVISGTIACKRSTPPPVETPASAMIPVGTVKDVMKGIIDPTSSVLWNSVGVESGPAGLIDRSPKNDEEWAVVQNNALSLAEAANLLEMPGRKMSKPEEANSKGTARQRIFAGSAVRSLLPRSPSNVRGVRLPSGRFWTLRTDASIAGTTGSRSPRCTVWGSTTMHCGRRACAEKSRAETG